MSAVEEVEPRLRPFDIDAVARLARHWASWPNPYAKNAGLDLAEFTRDPSPFSAAMLSSGLRILASAQRRSAARLEDLAIDLEIRVLDAEVDARLDRQRMAAA